MEAVVPGAISFLWHVPLLLVLTGGIVLCVVNWRKHPTASLLAVIGLAILLARTLYGLGWAFWMPMWVRSGGSSLAALGAFSSFSNLVQAIASAVGIGFMTAAIFADRRSIQ